MTIKVNYIESEATLYKDISVKNGIKLVEVHKSCPF